MPEVVTDGVSGRIVDSIEAAVCAAGEAVHMDRRKVRAEFARRFTAERMVATHIAAYRVLLARASANTKIMKLPVALPAAPELFATGLGTNGGEWRHSGLDLNPAR